MSTDNSSYDIIIVGAGAAGLMCAIEAGKRGRSVLVIDHAKKVGEKIRISGGGRCNFTNVNVAADRYISQNPHFCKSALARYTPHDFIALVDSYDIAYHEKTLGQLFCDGSAQQIVDMLLAECEKVGAGIRTRIEIETVARDDDGAFILETAYGSYKAGSLVVATGGPSIPKMGATGFAYDTARQFDVNVIKPQAALVPLTFTDDILDMTKDLSGVSVDPVVVSNKQKSFREALLFTHRGLSGPAILQISSYWQAGEEITVNLLPDEDMFEALKEMRSEQPKKHLDNFLGQSLPQRLIEKILPEDLAHKNMADLADKAIRIVADSLNCWQVKPNGSEGYRTAEVTKGGVDTAALSSQTFEVKSVAGLYFIGEAVDVTGWLGGYNFQWAWSSGWCAGQVA